MSIFRQVADSCSGVDTSTDEGSLVLYAAIDALTEDEREVYFDQSEMVLDAFNETHDWDEAVALMESIYGEGASQE